MLDINKRKRPQKGLTLVEVLIATGIFLGTITMMAKIQKSGIRELGETRNRMIAQILLQQKMEETLLQFEEKSFSDLDFQSTGEGQFGEDYPGFSWKREVSPYHLDVKKVFTLLKKSNEANENNPAFSLLEPYLENISEFISDSSREITVIVIWKEKNTEQKMQATTHLVKYDKKINLGGVGI